MKFTDGMWTPLAGYKIHTAQYLWKYTVEQDAIHAFVVCHPIQSGDDLTRGPALEFTFRAVGLEMCEVCMTHFKGGVQNAPAFSLNRSKTPVEIEEQETAVVMKNGRLTLTVYKGDQFHYTFCFEGKQITSSEQGSVAYITDADYEGELYNDVNRRTPLRPYITNRYLRERLDLSVGELIYGLGEHFTPIVKNGQTVDIWNRDGGSNTEQGYKCVPFYLSSRGYGLLVDTPGPVDYEIGTESVRHVQFSVRDEQMRYILIGGSSPLEVLGSYTALIGRTPVPPAWTFGLWLSSSWMPEWTADGIVETIDRMKENGIPLEVFHFDARWMEDFHDCDFIWAKNFGDAKQMLDAIHSRGVKVCVWINPYVSQVSRLFQEGLENGYFLKKKDGSVWQTDIWMCGMAIVDFTNPAAAKWYADRLGEIIDMGVDCIKTDFGERIPTDVAYFDGSDPEKMHNYYAYLYNRTIYNMLVEKRGPQEACVFARSATVGTQQFPINWGGDNYASYVSMAESLRGGLSFCQSGYGFWCHDMTGFNGKATPDLYKRWAAMGMLSTHSRLHSNVYLKMPWLYDDESTKVLAHFTALKNSLMPYLFAGAVDVHDKGWPEMRAMSLAFPEDPNCAYLDRQYMLGGDLLVAPVLNDEGTVKFYVPSGGVWTDFQSGEKFVGGAWYTRSYDYFSLPLLARPGALIATGAKKDQTVYDYADGAVLHLYELENGQTASCAIYQANTELCVSASASRQGNRIRIAWEGPDAGKVRAVCWSGAAIAAVTAAEMQPTENGVRLVPQNGAQNIVFELV